MTAGEDSTMFFKLKDGRVFAPVQMGVPDSIEPTDDIIGIDIDNCDKDLFGKPVIEHFKLSEVESIYGSYAFAPAEYLNDTLRRSKGIFEASECGEKCRDSVSEAELPLK